MWLKHTQSTQAQEQQGSLGLPCGGSLSGFHSPFYVFGTGHVYRTGQVWALKSHKYCPYVLHRHLGTDMPGQDSQGGHTGTRRDMQHCGMEQSGTRHCRAGAHTHELAVTSSQGRICSSTQALVRQGRAEGTRTEAVSSFGPTQKEMAPRQKSQM